MVITSEIVGIDASDLQEILVDAPSDGVTYGRRNGAWVMASGTGGGVLLGAFVDLAALQAAHPVGTAGDHAFVGTPPSRTIYFWDATGPTAQWTDSGVDSMGDMLREIYDPQGINADVFARANHTGSQGISTVSGLQSALDSKVDDSQIGQTPSDLVQYTGDADGEGGAPVAPVMDGRNIRNITGVTPGVMVQPLRPWYQLTRLAMIAFQMLTIRS